VVVIGYGTQRKVDLTGSVAIVNTEEMKNSIKINISTMLEGKVAGVSKLHPMDNLEPTQQYVFVVYGSFGSTAPLYVVDGVTNGNNNTRLFAKRYRNHSGT